MVCGWPLECPRPYAAADVNRSASSYDAFSASAAMALSSRRLEAETLCHSVQQNCTFRRCTTSERLANVSNGAWCLSRPVLTVADAQNRHLLHQNKHVPADPGVVSFLLRHMRRTAPQAASGSSWYSVNDFGAGVGQYGASLLEREPRIQYRGYDGAGNVESMTGGRVQFAALTLNLSLPRADSVLSLEVGEHVESSRELQLVRNLHAHNCRGLVLSWAVPFQAGLRHINVHSSRYIIRLFGELGYVLNARATRRIRDESRYDWFHRLQSLYVFERSRPVC